MRRLSSIALAAIAVVALSACITPPPAPAQDPGQPQGAESGADASGDATGPVWPENMASHGAIFTADGVLQTDAAAEQPIRQDVTATHVILYVDFQCPHCAAFGDVYDDELRGLVDDGSIALEIRPLSFVDPTGSARHAAAFAAVVDEFPEAAWAFQRGLLERQQQGGLSADELLELARAAGAESEQLEARIRGDLLLEFAQAASASGLSEPVVDGVPAPTSTPALYIDGEQFQAPADQPGAIADFIASQG